MVTTTGARITAAEFLSLPEDGRRHELIDGAHYVTYPNVTHQVLCGRLHLALGNFLATRPHLGRVFFPLDVVLSDYDVIGPDLLIVTPDQNQILTEMNVQGAPALAIEVLSPSTRRRDEGVKRRLLDENGAREYWLVDPRHARVTIFRRADDGSFPRVAEIDAIPGAELTSPLLPDLTLSVEQLFSER
ncbi:MAG: Uma2 family endonuclease [Vicinamibacterales bacterium]